MLIACLLPLFTNDITMTKLIGFKFYHLSSWFVNIWEPYHQTSPYTFIMQGYARKVAKEHSY